MQQVRRAAVAMAVVAALLAVVLPGGVSSSPKPRPTAIKPTPARRASTPAVLPTLRLAMPDASPTIDPALAADETNAELASLLYEGLVRLDTHYHVVPAAAARYTLAPDHRTYTFYLRHNLRFSNGQPIHASDFSFAITRSLDPSVKSPSAPTYLLDIEGAQAMLAGKAKSVSGIKVVGPYTLQITARWPVPYFLMELTYPTSYVLDERAIKKAGPVDNTTWYLNPVSSGPFKLASWTPNTGMVLVPNKYFAGAKPQLKQIVISLTPLPATGLYQYVTHNLDIVNLPVEDPSLAHRTGIRQTKMLAIDGIYMNMRTKPFDNREVRRALTLALDRSSIVTSALGKTVTPFGGYVPPGESGYDSALHVLPHDPAAARAALKTGLGSKSFPPFTLYYAEDPALGKLATAIAKAWHQTLGLTVTVDALTVNTLLAKVQSESLPVYLGGWSADYPDPHDWLSLQWQTGVLNNNVDYRNLVFDRLTQAADATWRLSRRQSLYNHAQQLLVDDAAWIPLYIPHREAYIRPQVRNVTLTGYGLIPEDGAWSRISISPVSRRNRGAF